MYPGHGTITETGAFDKEIVEVCVGKDLTVSKTATPTMTRTYTWTIDKSVDKTKVILEGVNPQTATFNYTVAVTHDAGTDSAWKVVGKITITNPKDWQDITLTNLTDVANDGSCTLDDGPSVVPKSGSLDVNYSCTWSSKPSSYSGTNTATATWDKATYFTPTRLGIGQQGLRVHPDDDRRRLGEGGGRQDRSR